jgi:predicted amidohydrolase
VSVLEVVSGNLELVDSTGATRVWRETLVPVATVKSGDVLRL